VDHQDDEAFLWRFVETVAESGCRTFIVHARKAWLKGLSPAQNRRVPPLMIHRVYRLKQRFPELEIILNGGILTPAEASGHLAHVDGVMVGRAAYGNPALWKHIDRDWFHEKSPIQDDGSLLESFSRFYEKERRQGQRPSALLKHFLNFFKGQDGSRRWRQILTQWIQNPPETIDLRAAYDQTIGKVPPSPVSPIGETH
jgi:tRNA-dihydrouridine synthase A